MDPLVLEPREPASGLLDEPFRMHARGAAGADVVWRARIRDDDGRVWRASAAEAGGLPGAWGPAKASTGAVAALASLRPVAVDVRVEADDGRAAARTLTRRLLADGVRVRRWRAGVAALLLLPAPGAPARAAVVLDGTDPARAAWAAPAAALLASRGVATLAVAPPRAGGAEAALAAALEALAAVPAAAGLQPATVAPPLPPGLPSSGPDPDARAAAWDALLAELGAVPREA